MARLILSKALVSGASDAFVFENGFDKFCVTQGLPYTFSIPFRYSVAMTKGGFYTSEEYAIFGHDMDSCFSKSDNISVRNKISNKAFMALERTFDYDSMLLAYSRGL